MEAPRPKTLCPQQYSNPAGETATHLGKTELESFLSRYYFIPKLPTLCAQIIARCVTCAQNNASEFGTPTWGLGTVVQTIGTLPFEDQKWTLLKSSPTGALGIYLW